MPKFVDFLVKPTNFSNYDLSCTKRFSASDGLMYPVNWFVVNPGEKFWVNIRSLIRTNPTIAPLMGRYKVRFVTAIANFKNYAVGLEGYRRSFDWRTFVLPQLPWAKLDNGDNAPAKGFLRYNIVKETSLMDYLGFERGFCPTSQQYASRVDSTYGGMQCINYNALPLLMYYDFYRNYMVNPQKDYYPMVVARAETDSQGNKYSAPYIEMKPIASLDTLYENIHKYFDGRNTGDIRNADPVNWEQIWPYQLRASSAFDDGAVMTAYNAYHGGLCATLFDPDINTQWLSTANFERLSEARMVGQTATIEGVSKTVINFQDVIKASAIWDFVSREIYGGGTYADHIYSQFGVEIKGDMNIPQIVHVYDSMIDFEDITSQSDTANGSDNPDLAGAKVGQQSGVGRGYGQSSRFKIRNLDKNYAVCMTFMWITPMVDYATGLDMFYGVQNFSDLYSPSFDNYSMQPRLQEQVNTAVVGSTTNNSVGDDIDPWSPDAYLGPDIKGYRASTPVGYQPAWSEYKTNLNRVHGLFANQLSYWSILRKTPQFYGSNSNYVQTYVYESQPGLVKPFNDCHGVNVPFSIENEDNFFCQVRFDITATRPMSKSVIPHVK